LDEDVSFETVMQRIYPEDRATVEREVRRTLADRSDYAGEFRVVLPDGSQRWIASRGRVYPDANGRPARMLGAAIDITVRKGAEDQLRQLSLALEQSPVLVVITDLQGKIIYVNRKFTEVTGYSVAECIGQNPRILKSGETAPSTYQELWACITSGETWRGEFHNRKKNGELYWEGAVISPLVDATGKVTHFVGVKEDITARKRAEEALLASQARLAAGTDLAGLGYYEVDYSEGTCFLDNRFRDICGVPPEVQPGLKPLEFWMEHVHPDDRQSLSDQREQLNDGKVDRISGEYRYLHPARGQQWIHHLARIAGRSAGGAGVRTFGVVRDITERKRLTIRLQGAAKEWQATFDSISDMVMILDPEYRIFRVNSAAERFLGLPLERIVGSRCYTLMHGTSCPIEGCPCQKTFQTRLRSEFELLHAGSGKWLLVSTDPILDAAGNVMGAVHVGRDITERKQAEAERLRERAELAHVARVSTMGELAASVAHELNQPLGAILANAEAAELFLEQEPPALDDLRAILADIRKDDERAGEVIRRMRGLLRKRELERQPLEINSLVEDVLQLVSGDAALRGVSLTADLGPILPKVGGDRVHLQQVLLNLILNGMDAMAGEPRDRRRLLVRTRSGADGQVELAVIDSGPGIAPDKLPRVFEPFYTTKPNGMGMGLSIARTIIDAHHGRIWAENNASGGAVFRMALPAAKEGQGSGFGVQDLGVKS
jgi:PAS domain S-box-containing protein